MNTPRRVAGWSLAGLAAGLLFGCAAGNSTEVEEGDGGADATLDGTSPQRDGGGDTGHHPGSGHDGAAKDARHDGHVEHDGSVDSGEDVGVDSGPVCTAPQVACPTGCASVSNDPTNCGSCGNVCSIGLVCSAGVCSVNCADSELKCMGSSADGGAKLDASVDASLDAGGHPDAAPLDGATDAAKDGSSSGVVDAGSNPSGDYCANPANDPLNCGGCGIECPHGPHSTPVCTAGKCSITCPSGYSDCDMNPADGCEVNTGSNPNSCGTCGTVCPTANDTPSCTNGVCGVGMCLASYANCDNNPANGCEVYTNNPSNCGGCGIVCPTENDTPGCPNGKCVVSQCSPGFADCNSNPQDGCETPTGTPSNCNGCGNACNSTNGTATCTANTCGIACSAGFANCDGTLSDGCETNISTNTNDCGGCGNICVIPNGVPACVSGMCEVGSCDPGFANCNAIPTDGCEINTGTDPNDCGGCGKVCSLANTAISSCSSGTCEVGTCAAGFANCDGNSANGCEVNTNTNVNDCGTCGHVCTSLNGTPSCVAGVCSESSCSPGFADCTGDGTNCSTNIETDDGNCGSCGHSCSAACGGGGDNVSTTQCNSGVCGISSCDAGFVDFDGNCANGCECKAAVAQAACGNAETLFTGTLLPGNSTSAFSSTMAPSSITQAYFTLTFGDNGSLSFHPLISISSTNNEFVMDVTSNCTGSKLTTCGDNGTGDSDGVLSWEESYTGPSPAGDPTSYPVTGSHFVPIPLPGAGGQVWIRVYRRTGVTPTCDAYTITASN